MCRKRKGKGGQRGAKERKGKEKGGRRETRGNVKEGGCTIKSLLGGEAIHVGGVAWVIVGRPRSHHVGLLVEGHLLLGTNARKQQNQCKTTFHAFFTLIGFHCKP